MNNNTAEYEYHGKRNINEIEFQLIEGVIFNEYFYVTLISTP